MLAGPRPARPRSADALPAPVVPELAAFELATSGLATPEPRTNQQPSLTARQLPADSRSGALRPGVLPAPPAALPDSTPHSWRVAAQKPAQPVHAIAHLAPATPHSPRLTAPVAPAVSGAPPRVAQRAAHAHDAPRPVHARLLPGHADAHRHLPWLQTLPAAPAGPAHRAGGHFPTPGPHGPGALCHAAVAVCRLHVQAQNTALRGDPSSRPEPPLHAMGSSVWHQSVSVPADCKGHAGQPVAQTSRRSKRTKS